MNELNCRSVVELVSDYLEDALAPEERAAVERHLAGCTGCETILAEFRDTIAMTGMLDEDSLSQEQRTVLLSAFRDWASRP